ncbi:hypothetical protein L204_102011 [Cryptococcus depauperatus]|nr:YTH domain family 2 [Cryptococcus depauperatus CBS 7855]
MPLFPAAPIRQPRGPSEAAFSSSNGPPAPEGDSLKRANTVASASRHQPSASISANSAASSAFHGHNRQRTAGGVSRLRSGSLSNVLPDPGLVRRSSVRQVRKDVVIEGESEGESSSNKGLYRQSSLPTRRGLNPVQAAAADLSATPPRPPRRIAINTTPLPTPTSPISAHSVSHSLSSLSVLNPPGYHPLDEPVAAMNAVPTGFVRVSRTQSLRAQAKHSQAGSLGRSISLKATGEYAYRPSISELPVTPSGVAPPTKIFSSSTPPPVSSTAALPPFQLPLTGTAQGGADVKRHQSLTQGYGSSKRVRERLEKSPSILTLDNRGTQKRLDSRLNEDEPPTSPIGRSVWSNNPMRTDDGWAHAPGLRNTSQQLQDAFEAMNLGRKMMGVDVPLGAGFGLDSHERTSLETNIMRQPQVTATVGSRLGGEESSWVNKLVGGDSTPMAGNAVPRSSSAVGWNEHGRQDQTRLQRLPYNQWGFNGFAGMKGMPMNGINGMNLGGMGMPMMGMGNMGMMNFPMGMGMPNFQPGMGTNFTGYPQQPGQHYPSPPNTADTSGAGHGPTHGIGVHDREVIELARSKGLNPATFDCQPKNAKFFVIKSYTEEDVQKSLKHEIWSSTVLGNKRLDAAYRDNAGKGPIYLFFSVNGSRHFCGVAEMITPVDETKTSKVWAQDKWKGVFEVKWIFARDVPSSALRHIRLTNTPECKPITNSRDTQELPYEAGCEVLEIFLDHQTKSKTSLLQDFAYYEQLSANRTHMNTNDDGSDNAQLTKQASPLQRQSTYSTPHFNTQPTMTQSFPMGISFSESSIPPVPPIPDRLR